MPGWSPDIANEFIRRGLREGRAFDQMQLQKLVYIAHGWCLAFSGEPLTGDRPEAWDFGPVYRRLANALQSQGTWAQVYGDGSGKLRDVPHQLIREQFVRYTEQTEDG